MNPLNPSVASLFDVLASELQTQWSEQHAENIAVSWIAGDESAPPELECWSWTLSIDSASRILLAAPMETWRELCGAGEDASPDDLRDEFLSRFAPVVERTAQSRFGSEVTCVEEERPDALPAGWTSVHFTIRRESGREVSIRVGVNPDLEAALGVETAEENGTASQRGAGSNPADILMDVEMPVSISLGRTKLRLKELLHLAHGSVVELDQELGDEVEIRVNNHVIAYGEVVSVDGNYAVRVLRMALSRNNPNLRGILPERAA